MEMSKVLAPLVFILISLMVGAILKSGLKKTKLPYTVGLFCFGILVGVLERAGLFDNYTFLESAISFVGAANPDMILYVFLPLLLFDAAYEMNVHIFKKTLANATLLAVPGMVVSMFLIGAMLMGIREGLPGFSAWNWTFALMFGALISATDPVAVVALLRELGTSKRFSTLVDSESMLNDGTGIVLFMLFFGAYSAGGASPLPPVEQFCVVVAGGVLLGYALAQLVIWLISRVNGDALLQNSMIILAAYLTFLLAQQFLAVSGVIALVAFGLTMTYRGKPRLKPEVNKFMEQFWELMAYIANTLIFIIVGIVIAIHVDFTWLNLAALAIIYIGVNLIRTLMIFLFYPLMSRLGYGLSIREAVILSWGGLRGALGLTLALMVSYALPIPEEVRKQVLFFTAGIVTLTLTLNATTTRWLLQKLGLVKVPSAKVLLDYHLREQIKNESEKYYERLRKRDALADANWGLVERFLPEKEPEPDMKTHTKDVLADVRLRVLDREKQGCRELHDEGVISNITFRKLIGSLDEQYDHDGHMPLSNRSSIYEYYVEPFYIYWLKRISWIKQWLDRYFHERVIIGYDLGRGFIVSQKNSLRLLDELAASDMFDENQKKALDLLKVEVQQNIMRIQQCIDRLAEDYPISYHCALTRKAIRMLLASERRRINQFVNDGLLSDDEAAVMYADIDERYGSLNTFKINRMLRKYKIEINQ